MRPVVYRAARPSTPDDANPHPTRTEPGAPRPPGAPGALRPPAAPVHRERRRPPDAVRTQRLHRDMVAPEGVRARRAHAGAGTRDGGAGHPDAQHDPHGLPARLLAHRHRRPGASAPLVAPGHPSCHERTRARNLGRPDPGCARRRPATPIRAGEGTRHGLHDLERGHRMAGSGPGAAERHLGAAQSRPLRACGGRGSVLRLRTSPRTPASTSWFGATSPGSAPPRARTSRASPVCRSPRWMRRSKGSASGGS